MQAPTSETTGKHKWTWKKCTVDHTLCLTYKKGPPSKANRRTTQYARKDKVQGPPVSLPDKDEKGEAPLGVGRTLGGVAAKSPNHLPYGEMAETGLQHYK